MSANVSTTCDYFVTTYWNLIFNGSFHVNLGVPITTPVYSSICSRTEPLVFMDNQNYTTFSVILPTEKLTAENTFLPAFFSVDTQHRTSFTTAAGALNAGCASCWPTTSKYWMEAITDNCVLTQHIKLATKNWRLYTQTCLPLWPSG